MNCKRRDLFVMGIAIVFIGWFLLVVILICKNNNNLREHDQIFYDYLNNNKDTLSAYLDGTEVDFTKLDLSHYDVKFSEDFTKIYLTKLSNNEQCYHMLPEELDDSSISRYTFYFNR